MLQKFQAQQMIMIHYLSLENLEYNKQTKLNLQWR